MRSKRSVSRLCLSTWRKDYILVQLLLRFAVLIAPCPSFGWITATRRIHSNRFRFAAHGQQRQTRSIEREEEISVSSQKSKPSRGKTFRISRTPTRIQQSTKQKNRSQSFDQMVDRLKDYKEKHGHTIVKRTDDQRLYTWCASIRRNYASPIPRDDDKQSTRSSYRIKPLEPLPESKLKKLAEADFVWNVQEATWELRYQELAAFYAQHGSEAFPRPSTKLGVWVQNQKGQYRRLLRGEPSSLTPTRVEKLQVLSFCFARPRLEGWEIRYQELVHFFGQHGHSDVPDNYKENYKLGQWCMNQRTAYRWYQDGLPTGLTADKVELLQDVNFTWNLQDKRWNEKLERVRNYFLEHGHVRIPVSDANNQDLRLWLTFQRYYYHRRQKAIKDRERRGVKSAALVASPLTEQRIEAIEQAIPSFAWKVKDGGGPSKEDWQDLFHALREKGIKPGMRAKQHWFEGEERFSNDISKEVWTEADLLELWNSESDDDEDDEDFD